MSIITIGMSVLMILQVIIMKLKLDFDTVEKLYSVCFLILILLVAIKVTVTTIRNKKWITIASRFGNIKHVQAGNIVLAVLIFAQWLINIVLYNTCYDYDATLETTRTILQTGTIYEYGAYTGRMASYPFPLSNKLMSLPVFYAWLSDLFHADAAVIIGIVIPTVIFICMYAVIILFIKKIYPEEPKKRRMTLFFFIILIWFGDYSIYTTAFNVLHEGYSGAAILFGVLIPFALYHLYQKKYFIPILTIVAVPTLIKYDLVWDFISHFTTYIRDLNTGGGYLLLWGIALFLLIKKRKKFAFDLLCIPLAIAETFTEVNVWYREKTEKKAYYTVAVIVCSVLIMLTGTVRILPNITAPRTNPYSIEQAPYDVLMAVYEDSQNKGLPEPTILASDEINKWIRRMNVNLLPLAGYQMNGYDISWYSYEAYEGEVIDARTAVNKYPDDNIEEFVTAFENVYCDYFVLCKGYIPVGQEDKLAEKMQCSIIYDDETYIVFAVEN